MLRNQKPVSSIAMMPERGMEHGKVTVWENVFDFSYQSQYFIRDIVIRDIFIRDILILHTSYEIYY